MSQTLPRNQPPIPHLNALGGLGRINEDRIPLLHSSWTTFALWP